LIAIEFSPGSHKRRQPGDNSGMKRIPIDTQLSIGTKLALMLMVAALSCGALSAWAAKRFDDALLGLCIGAIAALPLSIWLAGRTAQPLRKLLRALSGAVASYRDGDFSLSLVSTRTDELGTLVVAHNELGRALREQRQHLIQRELLLDTVMQNSPVALVLVDPHQRVVYANLASRHLLNDGRSLHGLSFDAVLAKAPGAVREAAETGEDSLIPVQIDGNDEIFHLSQRTFLLQGRQHHLYLLRRLTRELSRQEVATWKKLIRVLSHELNNSLAPISSLAHTGGELLRRGDHARLQQVFAGISERAQHLHGFLQGYASFARLPAPHPAWVEWRSWIQSLSSHCTFTLTDDIPSQPGWFDATQLEQALINLLKNAHEAGSAPESVELAITISSATQTLEVRDRGSGMSEAVLENALLPFYSTKRNGTGLGLALAREIVEAHSGRLTLTNRSGGGLSIRIQLPAGPRSR